MKTSRKLMMASVALALLTPIWAQNEIAPAKAEGPEIDLPKIEYPKPVTEEQKKAEVKHTKGSQSLAGEQDELSADVQELIEEQTSEKVISLLESVEEIMAEVTGSLDETDTGGGTIAAETEIIEKIFEAAEQRAQQNGGT
jgi:hypothetical protein